MYELGRDYSAVAVRVAKHQQAFVGLDRGVCVRGVHGPLFSANTSDEQQQIIKKINSTTAPSGLTFFPAFNLIDLRLSPSSVVLGQSEL